MATTYRAKPSDGIPKRGLRDVPCRVVRIRFLLQVVGRRGLPQEEGACIFLIHSSEFVNALCHFTCADDEQSGCQRIKRTGMTNFFIFS